MQANVSSAFREFVELTDRLLRSESTTYDGRFYHVHDAEMIPGPVQWPTRSRKAPMRAPPPPRRQMKGPIRPQIGTKTGEIGTAYRNRGKRPAGSG